VSVAVGSSRGTVEPPPASLPPASRSPRDDDDRDDHDSAAQRGWIRDAADGPHPELERFHVADDRDDRNLGDGTAFLEETEHATDHDDIADHADHDDHVDHANHAEHADPDPDRRDPRADDVYLEE